MNERILELMKECLFEAFNMADQYSPTENRSLFIKDLAIAMFTAHPPLERNLMDFLMEEYEDSQQETSFSESIKEVADRLGMPEEVRAEPELADEWRKQAFATIPRDEAVPKDFITLERIISRHLRRY